VAPVLKDISRGSACHFKSIGYMESKGAAERQAILQGEAGWLGLTRFLQGRACQRTKGVQQRALEWPFRLA